MDFLNIHIQRLKIILVVFYAIILFLSFAIFRALFNGAAFLSKQNTDSMMAVGSLAAGFTSIAIGLFIFVLLAKIIKMTNERKIMLYKIKNGETKIENFKVIKVGKLIRKLKPSLSGFEPIIKSYCFYIDVENSFAEKYTFFITSELYDFLYFTSFVTLEYLDGYEYVLRWKPNNYQNFNKQL